MKKKEAKNHNSSHVRQSIQGGVKRILLTSLIGPRGGLKKRLRIERVDRGILLIRLGCSISRSEIRKWGKLGIILDRK